MLTMEVFPIDTAILRLPDGTELSSGRAGDAIQSLTLHRTVNSGEELTLGSVCASYLEAEIWADPKGSLRITAGDELTLYRQTADGSRQQVGIYLAEMPTRSRRNSYRLTAYDRMTLLDFDVSSWLRDSQSRFPMTAAALLEHLQRYAATLGRTVAFAYSTDCDDTACPKAAAYAIPAFYAQDLTARQIVGWAAEMRGCFAAANAAGVIVFSRYADKTDGVFVAPQSGAGQIAYLADSLHYEDYTVPAVQKVQIRQSDSDVGVIYPDDTDARGAYPVQGNLLLCSGTEAALKPLAQELYRALSGLTYTPCRFTVPANAGLEVGQLVRVQDAHGRELTACLMSASISASAAAFEGVGSASRESSGAVNRQSYRNLSGKMLEIQTGVDGLKVKASELSGSYTALKATVDGLRAEVNADAKIVGGGNLILQTEDFAHAAADSPAAPWDNIGTYSITDGAAHVVNNGQTTRFCFPAGAYRLLKGVSYCVSVLYRHISGEDTLLLQAEGYDADGVKQVSRIPREAQLEIAQEDGWVLRYGILTATADASLERLFVSSGADGQFFTNEFLVFHPMLQPGNAPTAWQPCSGDFLSEESARSLIQQSADEITASVEKTAAESAGTAVNDALKSYSTTTETKALIRQSAESITSTVSQNTAKIDGLSGTVGALSVGGRNLLMNCGQYTRDAPLTVTVSNNGETTDGYNENLGICTSVSLTPGTYWLQAQTNGAWSPAHYNGGADASNKYVALWLNRRGADGGGTGYLFVNLSAANPAEITIDTAGVYYLRTNLYKQAAEDWPTVQLWNLQLEKGSLPTDWNPAPEDCPTNSRMSTEIRQTVDSIQLSAETDGTTSTLRLKSGSTELSSAEIHLTGVVTFTDLSTWQQDKTIINGGNITTGQIHNPNYTTTYDLDNATIQMGKSGGSYVYIDAQKIAWFGGESQNAGGGMAQGVIENGLTTSVQGDTTVIGADTRYQKIGWYHSGAFQGITLEQVQNEVQVPNLLSVGRHISCESLSAWGSKERVVQTPFGWLAMQAMESPEPLFCDAGSGVLDGGGLCRIVLTPEYEAAVSRTMARRWLVSPVGAPAALWAERTDDGALIHGPAGAAFDWLCLAVQRGFEGCYAERAEHIPRRDCDETTGGELLNAALSGAELLLPLSIEEVLPI